jgi:hypothetical protein
MLKNVPLYPSLGSVPGAVNAAVPVGGKAGQVVDCMTQGEIVDVPGLTAGSRIFTTAAGALSTTATGNFQVGFTVEATRLVVRVMPARAAG